MDFETFKKETGLPPTERRNPRNYTPVEWSRRDRYITDLETRYPKIPNMMLTLLVDNTFRKTEAELDDIIDSGKWDKATDATLNRQTGGIWSKGCYVLSPEEQREEEEKDLERENNLNNIKK